MHAYKLNNSYTVYVNYHYLNDCRKASKREKVCYTPIFYETPTPAQKSVKTVALLAINTLVEHKMFGIGSVVESDAPQYIFVDFNGDVKRFSYPQALKMGYLKKVFVKK